MTALVVIGGSNIDVLGTPDGELIAGESNPGRVRLSPGGVARNVAEAAVRLGVDTTLITAVGDDLFGQIVLESCSEAGVHVDGVIVSPDYPTSVYSSLLDQHGDMAAAVSDMAVMAAIGPDTIAENEELLRAARAILVDTNLERPALESLFALDSHAPVFVDAVSAAKASRLTGLLAQVHTLKLNRHEAEVLMGLPVSLQSGLDAGARGAAADRLLEAGPERVFLTLGPEGIFFADANERGVIAAPEVRAVNANGAGDAGAAALVAGYLSGESAETCARFCVAAATLAALAERTIPEDLSMDALAKAMKDLDLP